MMDKDLITTPQMRSATRIRSRDMLQFGRDPEVGGGYLLRSWRTWWSDREFHPCRELRIRCSTIRNHWTEGIPRRSTTRCLTWRGGRDRGMQWLLLQDWIDLLTSLLWVFKNLWSRTMLLFSQRSALSSTTAAAEAPHSSLGWTLLILSMTKMTCQPHHLLHMLRLICQEMSQCNGVNTPDLSDHRRGLRLHPHHHLFSTSNNNNLQCLGPLLSQLKLKLSSRFHLHHLHHHCRKCWSQRWSKWSSLHHRHLRCLLLPLLLHFHPSHPELHHRLLHLHLREVWWQWQPVLQW